MTKTVCVFASASNDIDEKYYKVARDMGALIGKAGYDIAYGGSRRGLMYACANATKEFGGKVYGVMPEIFVNYGFANPDDCDEFYVTKGMRERKAKLDSISDAVIALAGGYGTLEEISEMIVQKQLGFNDKPTVILNTDNFYKGLLEFFDHSIRENFAHENVSKMYFVANTPQEAIDYIINYQPETLAPKYVAR